MMFSLVRLVHFQFDQLIYDLVRQFYCCLVKVLGSLC